MLKRFVCTGLLLSFWLLPITARAASGTAVALEAPTAEVEGWGLWDSVVDGWNWTFMENDPEQQRNNKGLHLYKQNYGIFTWGSEASHGSDSEFKFQISARQHLFGPLYFAYTQKSFWRIWDGANSRPFRETNYNPEFFFRSRVFRPKDDITVRVDVSPMEHESNGLADTTSRSWNRYYLRPSVNFGWLEVELKHWWRWSEDKPRFEGDPQGDENIGIQDFYGHDELRLGFNLPHRIRLDLMGRHNFSTDKGAVQASLEIPLTAEGNAFVYLQYWDGYGESLIDFNRSVTSYGIGFSLHPGKKSLGEVLSR